jgi:hypothetical protein
VARRSARGTAPSAAPSTSRSARRELGLSASVPRRARRAKCRAVLRPSRLLPTVLRSLSRPPSFLSSLARSSRSTINAYTAARTLNVRRSQGTSRDSTKADCTHYCYSPLFFEPLLARLGACLLDEVCSRVTRRRSSDTVRLSSR